MILDRIVASKRDEVAARRAAAPLADLVARARDLPPCRAFAAAVARPSSAQGPRGRGGQVRAVAEIKRASPSRGPLRPGLDPGEVARGYRRAGAAALSVLTDGPFFGGSLGDLAAARAAVELPVLRKDFHLDAYQIWEARAAGADAVLLIAAILDAKEVADLVGLSRELGLAPLVEVHTGDEAARAIEAGADLVGINNRDLRDFSTSLETTFALLPALPQEATVVSESGIATPHDVSRLAAAGVDALLIGESLLVAPDPARALRNLLGGAPV